MGLGAYCRRTQWLTREADHSLANLTAKVLLPALFAERILFSEEISQLSATWMPPLFGFLTTTFGFILGLSFAKHFGKWIGLDTEPKQKTFALCVGICNYGYIPLPLADRFYPDAVVDLIFHNVGVDLALWSVGIAVISVASAKSSYREWLQRALLSPPVIAVVVAGTIKALGMESLVPSSILGAIKMLGSCAIPLGLLLSGAIIVDYMKEAQWNGSLKMIASAILFRQLLMPSLMLAGVATIGGMSNLVSVDLKQVVMLEAAMPAAVFPIVLVRLYGQDTTIALRVVLSTSIAGIVLVPVWLAVGKWWLGL